MLLFLYTRCFIAGMTKPLVPLRWTDLDSHSLKGKGRVLTTNLDISKVRTARVPYDSAQTICVDCVLELPERVTGEIGTDEILTAPGQFERLPSEPELSENPWTRRHVVRSKECGLVCVCQTDIESD